MPWPSPKALEALANCGHLASRYPDETYLEVKEALAQNYGVKVENIALGCGSTEILRSVDNGFLDPSQNVVAANPTFEAVLDYLALYMPSRSRYRSLRITSTICAKWQRRAHRRRAWCTCAAPTIQPARL
jgi:histidinol-phosphate/aromatic aminotransferase/cobyric acid decarboxylase-like protein